MLHNTQAKLTLQTILVLALTIILGATVICMLIFAPRLVRETLREKPLSSAQYITTVQRYLVSLTQGNLAGGANDKTIRKALFQSTRRTLELMGISLAFALPIGIAWGALMWSVRWRWLRMLLSGLNTLLNAVPSFLLLFLGMEFIANIYMETGKQVAFVQGYGLDRHLILPVFALAIRGAAFVALRIAVAQADILGQEWIRGARAKGLGGLRLWRKHVLPALYVPLLGITLASLRVILAGFVIVDVVYNWGGLGRSMLNANGYSATSTSSAIAVGAGIILFLLFLAADRLGRLGIRYASPLSRT